MTEFEIAGLSNNPSRFDPIHQDGNDNVVYISTFYRCINVKEGKFLFHVYRHIRAGHPEEGMLLSFG